MDGRRRIRNRNDVINQKNRPPRCAGRCRFILAAVFVVLLTGAGFVLAGGRGGSEGTDDGSASGSSSYVPMKEIRFQSGEGLMKVGETLPLLAAVSPEDASLEDRSWSSDDEGVARVDGTGLVAAVAPGTCRITLASKADPGIRASFKVTVAGESGLTYLKGILIVNKTVALPSTYNPGENPEARAAFDRMREAAAAEGLTLQLASSFRSYARQQVLYDSYVARDGQAAADTYSARPGHSEHQSGLAFDLSPAEDSFGGTPESAWVAANCQRFGFIIRYPKGKEAITGYQYEPWHLRYLGVETASKVAASGLTLEEYLGIDSKYR